MHLYALCLALRNNGGHAVCVISTCNYVIRWKKIAHDISNFFVAPYKAEAASSFSSGHSLQFVKERWGGLGHLLKIALLRGKVLVSNPLVERL